MLPQTAPAQQIGAGLNSAAPDPMVGRRLANYILGPGDEITILSVFVPEIAKQPIRITTSGDINLAMVGRFHAAGRTVEQLEEDVRERLKAYIKDPDIVVNLTQLKSQPVSVIGVCQLARSGSTRRHEDTDRGLVDGGWSQARCRGPD